MKQNKVNQLKCQFSNAVHKILQPDYDKTNKERGEIDFAKRKSFAKLSPSEKEVFLEKEKEQKLEMFDKIMSIYNELNKRISSTRYKKRAAKRKYLKMKEEGKLPKQKTTLAQWIEMQKNQVVEA